MIHPRMRLALLALLLVPIALPAHAAALRSPWDLHPPRPVDRPVLCPSLAPVAADITTSDYYSDAQHSRIDPAREAANRAATAPIDTLLRAAEQAADEAVATGSRDAARCTIALLTTQARAGAMLGHMSSNQAFYTQGWAFGALSIAWLKIRPFHLATADQVHAVTAWLARGAGSTHGYMLTRQASRHATDGHNNHLYWAGLAVMSAAIAADDRDMFDWGTGTYRQASHAIAPDGTLPLEMARGQRALHYHAFAAAPLVLMAELSAANGRDLYPMGDHALARLVTTVLAGLQDNQPFAARTGVAQDTPGPTGPSSSDLVWARPFVRRFPNPAFDALAQHVQLGPYLYLGGWPP